MRDSVRQIYVPTVMKRHNGTTYFQCERDDVAEARQRLYSALVMAIVPVLHLLVSVLTAPLALRRCLLKCPPQVG